MHLELLHVKSFFFCVSGIANDVLFDPLRRRSEQREMSSHCRTCRPTAVPYKWRLGRFLVSAKFETKLHVRKWYHTVCRKCWPRTWGVTYLYKFGSIFMLRSRSSRARRDAPAVAPETGRPSVPPPHVAPPTAPVLCAAGRRAGGVHISRTSRCTPRLAIPDISHGSG